MPQSVRPEAGAGLVEGCPDAVVVREQLRRLLAHPLFTNSKRYPVLLAYVVEQTLAGQGDSLKERRVGVEAFGRTPEYDVALDPVVRMTASEVRKRLAQYYYAPEHAGELVIELPVGSYVPLFRMPDVPADAPAEFAGSPEGGDLIAVTPGASLAAGGPVPSADPTAAGLLAPRWYVAAGALLLAAAVGFGVGRIDLPGVPTSLERFWAPIAKATGPVTYCLGEPSAIGEREPVALNRSRPNATLVVSDVVTLARSLAPLIPRHGAYRVVAASNTGFEQLREGPFVLIGAYDNPWTLRITTDLPFGFEYEGRAQRIVDRRHPSKRFWRLKWKVPGSELEQDFAIVARIRDKVTGQPAIILAGILGAGTEAAGEVVSDPTYLDAVLRMAPSNWEQMNLLAIIGTEIIQGHPGPPTVMAVEVW